MLKASDWSSFRGTNKKAFDAQPPIPPNKNKIYPSVSENVGLLLFSWVNFGIIAPAKIVATTIIAEFSHSNIVNDEMTLINSFIIIQI